MYVSIAKEKNFIAIGWAEMGSLEAWETRDYTEATGWGEFKDSYREVFSGSSKMQVGIQAGQVWAFVTEMMPDDLVVVPNTPDATVLVGRIDSGYTYVPEASDGCPYPNRRRVTWLNKVARGSVAEPLRTKVGGLLTVYRIPTCAHIVDRLVDDISPEPSTPVSGSRLVDALIDRLLQMDPTGFEAFVASLLTAMGFTATVTEPVGDRGVDVVGTLDAEGLAELSLNVQVKRKVSNIGAQEVQQLRGTLGPNDHAAFVTLGGFTKQAEEEAQKRGRPIRLVTGEILVDMILRHFDDLDPQYQAFLGVRRRDTDLAERFEIQST